MCRDLNAKKGGWLGKNLPASTNSAAHAGHVLTCTGNAPPPTHPPTPTHTVTTTADDAPPTAAHLCSSECRTLINAEVAALLQASAAAKPGAACMTCSSVAVASRSSDTAPTHSPVCDTCAVGARSSTLSHLLLTTEQRQSLWQCCYDVHEHAAALVMYTLAVIYNVHNTHHYAVSYNTRSTLARAGTAPASCLCAARHFPSELRPKRARQPCKQPQLRSTRFQRCCRCSSAAALCLLLEGWQQLALQVLQQLRAAAKGGPGLSEFVARTCPHANL